MQIILPVKVQPLLKQEIAQYRNIILYGSRGSSKSHSIAIILLIKCLEYPHRILCVREFQSSIKESCHKLFCDYIDKYKLGNFFDTTNNKISGSNGSEIIFSGIRNNPQSVKSLEGITICWCEESQTISQFSLDLLIPTIRKPGSQIWFSMNPYLESDPVYQMIINPKPKTLAIKMNYQDNPFCPQVLIEEANHMKETDEEKWDNVWGGNPLRISDAVIFKGKFEVKEFEPDAKSQWRIGIDFGYTDSLAATKSYISTCGEYLYICEEAGGTNIETDDMPGKLIEGIPIINKWPCKADSADPKAILYLRRRGFLIKAVKKGPNSILDGITYLKSFRKIYIHPRCKMTIEEFTKYSWEIDKQTDEILPRPKDKFNHFLDSLRYALEDIALKKGTSAATWEKLSNI